MALVASSVRMKGKDIPWKAEMVRSLDREPIAVEGFQVTVAEGR